MKLLKYNNKFYIKCAPVKSLFKSNLIHEVVTRGDVFVVDIETGDLTVLPGEAQVQIVNASVQMRLL
jgi:hypothetical protein